MWLVTVHAAYCMSSHTVRGGASDSLLHSLSGCKTLIAWVSTSEQLETYCPSLTTKRSQINLPCEAFAMAAESGTQSSPASQGTSGYQEALGGIDKTVSTAGLVYSAIDQYVAAPYSRWRLSTQKSNDARLALGEWHEYLYNPAGKFYMNPVLSEIGLQAHLKSSRGQATPQGPCKATARWAQLLHALEIRPETGIVSRNTSEQHKDVDTLRLEVEGSAMCHVINLFCVRPSRRGETQLRLTGSGVSGNPGKEPPA